jgi:ATP synthase protein I
MSNQEEPKFKGVVSAANKLSLGISMVVAILIGVGIGMWLYKTFDNIWLLWLGIFWGVGAAGLNIYKMYQSVMKDLDEVKNDPKYKNYNDTKDDD